MGKASSRTHWVKGSHTTGQASSTPSSAVTCSTSAGVVTGVIRSTMQLGKETLASIQSASSGSLMRAWPTTAVRATFPLPGRLSQLMTVKGAVPSARRRLRASTM